MDVFDDAPAVLGEGPLWHPSEQAFYWFDIVGQRLHRRKGPDRTVWDFDEPVSAAGWIDDGLLLMATATGLNRFDTRTGKSSLVVALEADNPLTRSNDGRADSLGGFWIGTMGRNGEQGAGSIYRYYRGEVRRLVSGITIPNAISFAPSGTLAYYADSPTRKIMKLSLDPQTGWPVGGPDLFTDLGFETGVPDGAVVDADRCLWNAQWGASRVACYGPDGALRHALPLPVSNVTCPAFGGENLTDMFITTAREGLDADALASQPLAGQIFTVSPGCKGQAEHRVIL